MAVDCYVGLGSGTSPGSQSVRNSMPCIVRHNGRRFVAASSTSNLNHGVHIEKEKTGDFWKSSCKFETSRSRKHAESNFE